MGMAKRMMEEAETRMFWPSGDRICADHLHDAFLRTRLAPARYDTCCVACGLRTSSVDLDDLMEIVVASLQTNRRRAVDDLYLDRESKSGYALATVVDTSDAVMNDLIDAVDVQVAELIAERLQDEGWFDPGELWLIGTELMSSGWTNFVDWIKGKSIDLADIEHEPLPDQWMGEQADGIPPSRLLAQLIKVFDSTGALIELPPAAWYRITYLSPEEPRTAARLGAPPIEFATRPNRFSQVGVSAFYCASEPGTAFAETPRDALRDPVLSKWTPSRPLNVVDLTRLPRVPSYWDTDRTNERHWLTILQGFSADVSIPIGPDDKVRDYRPTQAVSHAIRQWGKADGIVFASSKTGTPNCVLFINNSQCVDAAQPNARDLLLVLEETAQGGS